MNHRPMTIARGNMIATPSALARHLGLDPLGAAFKSPFREDTNPSCALFSGADGVERMMDYREGTAVDGLGFMAQHLGCSRNDAIDEFLAAARQMEGDPAAELNDDEHFGDADAPYTGASLEPIDDAEAASPTSAQLEMLATSRRWVHDGQVVTSGLELAAARRILRVCKVWTPGGDADCWQVIDDARYCAQVRRLDGRPLKTKDGETKAKTIRGSCIQWPVGLANIGDASFVILVEGSSDLLAAHAFMDSLLPAHGIQEAHMAAIAMLGASAKIHPQAIARLRGRTVIILADADAAGQKAMKAWMCSLHLGGVRVYAQDLRSLLGHDGKDLEDLYRLGLARGRAFDIFTQVGGLLK